MCWRLPSLPPTPPGRRDHLGSVPQPEALVSLSQAGASLPSTVHDANGRVTVKQGGKNVFEEQRSCPSTLILLSPDGFKGSKLLRRLGLEGSASRCSVSRRAPREGAGRLPNPGSHSSPLLMSFQVGAPA